MREYEVHPAAEEWPLLEGAEFDAFCEDMRTGQKLPCKLLGGKIIDGRNRYLACKRLGIECRFEDVELDGRTPEQYVDSLNGHRRHLTAKQRQQWVVRLRGRGLTQAKIAVKVNASIGTVNNDLAQAEKEGTGPKVETIPGKDGKKYPTSKKPAARRAQQPKPDPKPAPKPVPKPAPKADSPKGGKGKDTETPLNVLQHARDEIKRIVHDFKAKEFDPQLKATYNEIIADAESELDKLRGVVEKLKLVQK